MKYYKKISATILSLSLVFGSLASTMSPATVWAANTDSKASEITDSKLANDDEWLEKNDPLYAKYHQKETSRLTKSKTATLRETIRGAELTHDPRFDASAKTYGMDVSKWQGNIDFNAAKADGIDFVIIRLGYRAQDDGTLTLDPYFTTYMAGAYAAGMKIGVYFYTQAITVEEAKAEADFCVSTLAAYPGYLSYPVFYDIENTATDRMGTAQVTTEQRTAFCQAFCDEMILYGYQSGVYASLTYFGNSLTPSLFSPAYHNWLARYASAYNTNGKQYDGAYEMWQYTSDGTVAGIAGRVDLDVAYSAPTVPIMTPTITFNWAPDFSSCTVTMTDEYGNVTTGACVVTASIEVAPTCTTPGKTLYVATYGDKSESKSVENIPATGHTPVVVDKVDATYFDTGYTGDTECSVCGEFISEGKEIAQKKLDKEKITSLKSTKSKKATLKWKKNSKATGYQIQYSSDKSCTKLSLTVNVKSKKTTSKTLSCRRSKTKYYFRVRAYRTEKVDGETMTVYGPWSSIKAVKIK